MNKGCTRRLRKCLHLSARNPQMVPIPSSSADLIETPESGHWAAEGPVLGKPTCVPLGTGPRSKLSLPPNPQGEDSADSHCRETLCRESSAGGSSVPFLPLLLTYGAPGFLQRVRLIVSQCTPGCHLLGAGYPCKCGSDSVKWSYPTSALFLAPGFRGGSVPAPGGPHLPEHTCYIALHFPLTVKRTGCHPHVLTGSQSQL